MTGVRVRIKTLWISTITVADSLFVPAPLHVNDSVRYHLLASSAADILHWWPDSLFADPSAARQIGIGRL